jgi:parvulin-like peptidyl-prolyl isomerase
MKWKLIIVQLGVLAALTAVYVVTRHAAKSVTSAEKENEPLVRNLPLERIAFIDVSKGDAKVALSKKAVPEGSKAQVEEWTVSSAWDYPADTQKVRDLVDKVRTLKLGQYRGDNEKMLGDYGLDGKERTTVEFKDAKGIVIASVILGKANFSMLDFQALQSGKKTPDTSTTYVMLPGTTTVHEVPGSHSVSAERTAWLDLKVLDIKRDDIAAVQIQRGTDAFAFFRGVNEPGPGEKPPEKGAKPQYEWFLQKGRQAKETAADEAKVRAVLDRLSKLDADDVAEQMKLPAGEQTPSPADLAKYGFDEQATMIAIYTQGAQEPQPSLDQLIQIGKPKDKDECYVHFPQKRSQMETMISALADNPDQYVERIPVFRISKYEYDALNKEAKDFEKPPEKPADNSEPPKDKIPGEKVQASHILIAYKGAEGGAVDRTKEEAQKLAELVLKKAQEPGADFSAIAGEFSDCPSKSKGGDLGEFGKGEMDKAFEDTAFALKPGEMSGIVETKFGFHIIKRTK